MKSFVVNRYGRLVFPFNFFPELDFSIFESLEQFAAVIKRDFEEKAPSETDIVARLEAGLYRRRHELLRDLALNLFWVNRYAMTMYDKRPTRWRDVPRHRDDVFLPVFTPWDGAGPVARIEAGYRALGPTWDEGTEDKVFRILFDVFRHKKGAGRSCPPSSDGAGDPRRPPEPHLPPPRVRPRLPGLQLRGHRRVLPPSAELEALSRQAMVLHNQYRWDRGQTRLTEVGRLAPDDFVVVFHPRTEEVLQFIRRVKGSRRERLRRPTPVEARKPASPYPPVDVRARFAVQPRLEALAVYRGERVCTNDDLIRNAAYCWSPMTADEIREKTGIEQRRYTELELEHMALLAATAALAKSGHGPEEIGALLFCSCTSVKMMPSVGTWLSGQLGMFQTHVSCDLVAACAGLPYGLAEAVRLLQEVERPVLVVCGEKFSDKIGTVRTSRMIFGDAAAALVLAPAPAGAPSDIEVYQTYASGP